MKLTVLTENMAGGDFYAEHELSYMIEHEKKKILFYTGHSNIFIKNAKKLGIDIQAEITNIVLSHGHWDHGNGLKFLTNKTLICHPNVFMKRYRKNDNTNIGLANTKGEFLDNSIHIVSTREPYWINENIVFLGEIPRLNEFEAKSTGFMDENGKADFVRDDSAMVIAQNNGLVIVTGCSHSGICNIITHAIKVTGINNINTVIGGFHLKYHNEQAKKTIDCIKHLKVQNVYPSHCTELPALAAFYNEFGMKQVKTGMVYEFCAGCF